MGWEFNGCGGGKGGLSEDRLCYYILACGIVPNFQLRRAIGDLGLARVTILTGIELVFGINVGKR